MAESKMPAMIWATCNGMSTRLPDGHRQFVGGWSEDKDRPRAEQFIRADLVEPLVEALKEARDALNGAPNTIGLHSQIDTALTSYREASNVES